MQLFSQCPHSLICCSTVLSLNLFQWFDVAGCEGIPDRADILQHGSDACLVCCIFQPLVGGLDVASEEAQGLVGFVADISDVGVSKEVRGDLNSKAHTHTYV